LKDLLTQLEESAAKLTAAMFSAPGGEGLRAESWSAEEHADNIQQLLKSALDDVKSK